MTVVIAPTCKVSCDDKYHVGIREHTVQSGTRVSAESALVKSGWGVTSDGNKHRCPACYAQFMRRN